MLKFFRFFKLIHPGLIFTFWLCLPHTGLGVWEHSPISQETRIAASRSSTWEFSLIFTEAAMYPGAFYCPAGSRVIVHVFNLSPKYVFFKSSPASPGQPLVSWAQLRVDLGNMNKGDFHLGIEIPAIGDLQYSKNRPVAVPNRLDFPIHSGTWPGHDAVYQTAWMMTATEIFPRKLILPSGRKVEIFIGCIPHREAEQFKIGNSIFNLRPGEVSLTEIFSPKGSETAFQISPAQSATLSIR